MIDFHNISSIRERLDVYVQEVKLELGDVVGFTVNYITFIRGIEFILKDVGGIFDTDGEVVRGYNINNKV